MRGLNVGSSVGTRQSIEMKGFSAATTAVLNVRARPWLRRSKIVTGPLAERRTEE
jgi:hypothetical protein